MTSRMLQRFPTTTRAGFAFAANSAQPTAGKPANAPDAPPGNYLLFILSDAGVQSVGNIVRLM